MTSEVRISLSYFVLGVLWILFSDSLVNTLFSFDNNFLSTVQTYKGWFFIAFTAVTLYGVLRVERKAREKVTNHLHENENKFRHLFLHNPLPMWVYDMETLRFMDVNDTAIHNYGYSRAEFLSMTLRDIRPPEDVALLLNSVERPRPLLQSSGRWRHKRKDGQIMLVEIVSHTITFNGRNCAMVVAKDVTEQERIELALQQTNKTLEAVIHSSPLAITVLDQDMQVRMWNPAAEQVFGWKEEAVLGKTLPTIPESGREEFQNLIKRVLAGGMVKGYEMQRIHADGRVLDVSVSMSPIRDGSEAVRQVMSITLDITEQKRMKADLVEQEQLHLLLNRELELSNIRNRFMSMISHEFRTPLSVIAMSNSMLENYIDRISAEKKKTYFKAIDNEVNRLNEMLNDILMVLRTESINPEFNPVSIDIIAFCGKVVEEVGMATDERHHIEYKVLSPAVSIFADEKMLRYALSNLLTNAIKYSPDSDRVWLDLWQEKGRVGLRVRDKGIGIPQADLENLFEPFYRAANVGEIPGTGLGLAILKQAVEMHGGTLELESKEGEGSAFTIYLPAEELLPVPVD